MLGLSTIKDYEVQLHTAGNIANHELIFKVGSISSCGGISHGIPCRLSGNRLSFVIDPHHLQEILDKWKKARNKLKGWS